MRSERSRRSAKRARSKQRIASSSEAVQCVRSRSSTSSRSVGLGRARARLVSVVLRLACHVCPACATTALRGSRRRDPPTQLSAICVLGLCELRWLPRRRLHVTRAHRWTWCGSCLLGRRGAPLCRSPSGGCAGPAGCAASLSVCCAPLVGQSLMFKSLLVGLRRERGIYYGAVGLRGRDRIYQRAAWR